MSRQGRTRCGPSTPDNGASPFASRRRQDPGTCDRPGWVLAAASVVTPVFWDRVEREDQIAPIIGFFDPVLDVDVKHGAVRTVGDDVHRIDLYPRLPAQQRIA